MSAPEDICELSEDGLRDSANQDLLAEGKLLLHRLKILTYPVRKDTLLTHVYPSCISNFCSTVGNAVVMIEVSAAESKVMTQRVKMTTQNSRPRG